MAIAKMSHIRLIGLRSQENKILDELTAGGLFEARRTESTRAELSHGDGSLIRKLKQKQGRVAFALGFLKARHAAMDSFMLENKRAEKRGADKPYPDYTLSDEKYGEARTLITHADFSDARAKEFDLLQVCDALQNLSFDIVDAQGRVGVINNSIRTYAPYSASPLKLSLLNKGGVVISMYYSRTPINIEPTLDAAVCAYDVTRGDGMLVVTVARSEHNAELEKTMSAAGFARCSLDDDCTAAQKIDALRGELDDVKRQIFELNRRALGYEKYVGELKILYDVIELEIERAEADGGFLKTGETFVLEGWLPETSAQSAVRNVEEKFDGVFVQLLAPEDRDEPPTLVVNNNIVKPYEEVTNMYSPPSYKELDPNPIMSIFYFIFFGLMIGDAAYGLILAVAGLILGRSKKFDTGAKKLMLMIGMGGISAVVWGILFGGYFAIDFGTDISLWFNPIEDPMMMLIVSIVLGCVQMTVGYIIKFVRLCLDGKPFSAVFDAGSIILLFGALACLGLSVVIDNAPKALSVSAIVLAAVGLALIIIFGGRNNKSVVGKMFGGFKGVYGLVNLLSDVLSYCRLFGLGLASAAIGLAFNTLGTIIFGIPVVGYPIGIIVLIPLHAFNIAIGVLGAYVHNARLQFLEFYGKFYDGGGRLFEPMGVRTKYTRFS